MILDTSAVVAILKDGPEAQLFIDAMGSRSSIKMSVVNLVRSSDRDPW